jgi:hypothetical protein
MDLLELAKTIGLYAGTAAFFGLALLIPLYFSQARDLRRLRDWAALAPERGTAEFQAAESSGLAPAAAIAPTSATAVEAPSPAVAGTTPPAPIPAAQRVARERPAAARVTAERPALVYADPWWRRFLRRPDPRYLAAMVAAVLVVGIAGAVLAVQLTEEPGEEGREKPVAVAPGDVQVAVLNGTAVPGLAAAVGDDIEAGGFQLGNVTNSVTPFERTVVMFERGQEDEAEAVAKRLGVKDVKPMDAQTRELAEGADAVVIAGEDRVRL